MSLACNVSSTWRTANVTYANVSSTWRHVPQVYVKINGTWRPVWRYYWSTSAWSECSRPCDVGYQYRTINCTRNDRTVWDARVCNALIGTNSYSTQAVCNTHACGSTCHFSSGKDEWEIYLAHGNMYGALIRVNSKVVCHPDYTKFSCVAADGVTYTRGAQKRVAGTSSYYEVCY